MPDPYGYTIFCDDIREEVGGKETFVGIYNGILFSKEIPTVLPKLCLAIHYSELESEAPEHVEMLIYMPGDEDDKPSMKAIADFAEIKASGRVAETAPPSPERRATLKSRIALSPMVLTQEGAIKVRVNRGDKIVKCGQLKILKGPAEPEA